MAGVTPECIRRWSNMGILPPAVRTPGGHRRFTSKHVAVIQQLMAVKPAENKA